MKQFTFILLCDVPHMVVVRCSECGFDCDYAITGNVEEVIFDYWNHMNKEHGIDYHPETIEAYLKRKIHIPIPAS